MVDKIIEMIEKNIEEAISSSNYGARLALAFSWLNETGQQKAVERVEELTEIPKYQKKDEPEQK